KRRAYIWITYCCPEPGRASGAAKRLVDVERRQFDARRCRASPRIALPGILQPEQNLIPRSYALEMRELALKLLALTAWWVLRRNLGFAYGALFTQLATAPRLARLRVIIVFPRHSNAVVSSITPSPLVSRSRRIMAPT